MLQPITWKHNLWTILSWPLFTYSLIGKYQLLLNYRGILKRLLLSNINNGPRSIFSTEYISILLRKKRRVECQWCLLSADFSRTVLFVSVARLLFGTRPFGFLTVLKSWTHLTNPEQCADRSVLFHIQDLRMIENLVLSTDSSSSTSGTNNVVTATLFSL